VWGVDAARHEVVALAAQDTDDLGGKGFVQKLDHRVAVRLIPGRDCTLLDMLPGQIAQRLNV